MGITSLLDVILATISVTLVILTILYTIFNVQQMAYNVDQMLLMNRALDIITEIVDDLADVGMNMPPLSTGDSYFLTAEPNEMEFWMRRDYEDSSTTERHRIWMEPDLGGNFILSIDRGTAGPYSSEPFVFTDADIFTYFGKDGNQTTARDSIYSCQIDLRMTMRGWQNDADGRLTYPLTIWRYFKNIYIKDYPL